MKLSGRAAIAFCPSPKVGIRNALIFGRDSGVNRDNAELLAKAWGAETLRNRVVLSDEDIKSDPLRLVDALEAKSLFSDIQLVWLHSKSETLPAILKQWLERLASNPKQNSTPFIVMAGELSTRSKLRKAFEDSPQAYALHFYADHIRDIRKLVSNKLSKADIKIHDDALEVFVADLPGHRAMANMEIEKLSLYGMGRDTPITLDDITRLSATDAPQAMHNIMDYVLDGDIAKTMQGLDKILESGTGAISILRALQRENQRMMTLHQYISEGMSLSQAGKKLTPRLFDSQIETMQRRLRTWPTHVLLRMLSRIYESEKQCKLSSGMDQPIISKFLIDLAGFAARHYVSQSAG